MTKRLHTALLTLAAGAALMNPAFAANAQPTLAERHAAMKVECAVCHVKGAPAQDYVTADACLACHGSFEKVAERTAKMNPNPHYSHLGKVRCSDCHSGHQQPKNMCNDCHQFDFKTK